MRRTSFWLFIWLLLLTAVAPCFGQPRAPRARPAATPATGETAKPAAPVEPLRTAGDRPIDIQHIRLDLHVDLPKKTVDARATLRFRTLRSLRTITLDAVDFEVNQVALQDGKQGESPAPYGHDGHKLVVDLDKVWPAGKTATLRIDYRVREPKAGLHFFGPTKAEPAVPLTVWSQGESLDNRYWIPCLDQPNQRQTTEMVVTVADGLEAVSNGKLLERHANPDKTVTFHWLQDKPHPSYLITLVVGPFDVVEEKWEDLPVRYYVPRGHKGEVARSFGRTRDMLSYFSQRFGIRYPWDQYAQIVAEQYGGGMENTSATTLGSSALHDERSILDGNSDSLISHELAHQWWGDLVTCRDWAHIWLNEGFASYAEALWDEKSKGPDAYAYNMYQKARGAISGGRARPVVDRHYPNADSMFDSRAYPKGAWLLHMLRHRLGEEAFWRSIQRYGTENRLQSVETADFRRVLERESGRDLERFFYDWTERPGNPVLEVALDYLPEAKQARVVVKQTQSGEPFHFPLPLVFRCPGTSAPVRSEEDVTGKEHTFYVTLPDRPTLAEVDPDQAVLAEIKETKGRDLWRAQLREGSTVVSRLRAAQHLAQDRTAADQELLAGALANDKYYAVRVEAANLLGDIGGSATRDALLAGLKQSDPRVRRACVSQLGKFRRDDAVKAAVKALLEKGDPSYGVEAAALGTYARLQPADAAAVLTPWLDKPSRNEALRSAALSALGSLKDLSLLDTLIAWTKPGKPRACRSAALTAVAQLAQSANPNEEQRKRIFAAVSACLEEDGSRLRTSAIFALRNLGQAATPALATLDALSLHDPNSRIRDIAKRTAEQIRNNPQAPADVARLRDELERLKRDQEVLKERLNKYEKADRKTSEKATPVAKPATSGR